jgi:hypothetical protein
MSTVVRTTRRADAGNADRAYLVVSGLSDPVQSLLAQFAVQSARAAVILAQPDLDLTILPTLPSDQALLRQHVNQFRNSMALSGGIMAALQAIVTISNQFVNASDGLLGVARTLDSGTYGTPSYDESLEAFRMTLGQLSIVTTSLNPDSGSAALAISGAHAALEAFVNTQIADDTTRFETAVKQAKFSGNLAALKLQISALRKQMAAVNDDIAEGAAAQIGPALNFGFTISQTLASASTDPGQLVLVGAFMLKDAVEKGNAFIEEMKQRNQNLNALIVQYRNLVESLAEAEQEMSALLTISAQCETFGASVSAAADALSIILGQLQLLNNSIAALTAIDSSTISGFFTRQLNEAIEAWQAMADNCTSLLTLARTLNAPE